MSMTRGLHPETMPQRAGIADGWAVPQPDEEQVERSDAPMSSVAKGLGWIVAALVLIIGAVLIFTSAIKPRTPLIARTAEARFRAPAPPLQVAAPADRVELERAHRAPNGSVLDEAVDQVIRQGWGDSAPPPSRQDVAMHRAGAGR
jgi:hypothetical protein